MVNTPWGIHSKYNIIESPNNNGIFYKHQVFEVLNLSDLQLIELPWSDLDEGNARKFEFSIV